MRAASGRTIVSIPIIPPQRVTEHSTARARSERTFLVNRWAMVKPKTSLTSVEIQWI